MQRDGHQPLPHRLGEPHAGQGRLGSGLSDEEVDQAISLTYKGFRAPGLQSSYLVRVEFFTRIVRMKTRESERRCE
jgi:hypothetical protein